MTQDFVERLDGLRAGDCVFTVEYEERDAADSDLLGKSDVDIYVGCAIVLLVIYPLLLAVFGFTGKKKVA